MLLVVPGRPKLMRPRVKQAEDVIVGAGEGDDLLLDASRAEYFPRLLLLLAGEPGIPFHLGLRLVDPFFWIMLLAVPTD